MADMSDSRPRIEGEDDIWSLRRDLDELRSAMSRMEASEPGEDVRIVAGRGMKVERLDNVWSIVLVGNGAQGGGGGGGEDPHLVVRIDDIRPNPTTPNAAWTLDGASVPVSSSTRILVYAMALADADGPYTVIGNGKCVAHRVRGVFGNERSAT